MSSGRRLRATTIGSSPVSAAVGEDQGRTCPAMATQMVIRSSCSVSSWLQAFQAGFRWILGKTRIYRSMSKMQCLLCSVRGCWVPSEVRRSTVAGLRSHCLDWMDSGQAVRGCARPRFRPQVALVGNLFCVDDDAQMMRQPRLGHEDPQAGPPNGIVRRLGVCSPETWTSRATHAGIGPLISKPPTQPVYERPGHAWKTTDISPCRLGPDPGP